MGRAPCCDKANVKRGPWSPEEDATLKTYLHKHGTGGNWISLPQRAGLKRCGKSCRLRWLNYLRPDIKHGAFTEEEDSIIFSLYSKMGSRWSVIAANLPGRTDNDVKNHWNTKLKKKLFGGGNTKFSPSANSKINNVTFTNNISNPIFQAPASYNSTPTTPSASTSPSYLDNNHNMINHHDQKSHQIYVPFYSFSELLAHCSSNATMSSLPNFTSLSNLDHTYSHDTISNPLDHLVKSEAQFSSSIPTIDSICPPSHEEASSASGSSAGVYGSSSLEDDSFLAEFGFGLVQEVMINPTCSYGDQEDVKPQGLGQGVANY